MSSRHFDTVVFDVRDNATMLFFATTSASGDIEDYVLLMRMMGDEFNGIVFIEINEMQLPGGDILTGAAMAEGMLTLNFRDPVEALGGAENLILSFDQSPENRNAIEAGVFRVLGEKLEGGHA